MTPSSEQTSRGYDFNHTSITYKKKMLISFKQFETEKESKKSLVKY